MAAKKKPKAIPTEAGLRSRLPSTKVRNKPPFKDTRSTATKAVAAATGYSPFVKKPKYSTGNQPKKTKSAKRLRKYPR